MNIISKTTAAAAIALAGLASTTAPSVAVSPNFTKAAITKINHDGFRACRSLGSSGYTAVARGIHSAGGGGTFRGGFEQFTIRTCFASRSKCENFLNRIHHKVANIEQFHFIRCSSRA